MEKAVFVLHEKIEKQGLGWCISSLLAQTYADLEVVVLVKPSCEAFQIAQNYAGLDPRVKLVEASADGVFSVRETAGKYFVFLEHSTYIGRRWLENMTKTFSGASESVLCACKTVDVSDSGVPQKISDMECADGAGGMLLGPQAAEMLFDAFRNGEAPTVEVVKKMKTSAAVCAEEIWYTITQEEPVQVPAAADAAAKPGGVGKRVVRLLRRYEKRHPGSAAGRLAGLLYRNLETVGVRKTLKLILGRLLGKKSV